MSTEVVNRANHLLRTRGYAFGMMITVSRDPIVMRYIADEGYDWVTIDTEHSALGWETVSDMLQMARACGLTPIMRLAEVNRNTVNRALDLGAMGLMVHDIERPEQVEELLEWTVGSKFAGRTGDADTVRDEFTLSLQIESKAGLERLDEILSVGRVDVVEVGRGDLSMSLGHPLDRQHPDVMEALAEIVAGCRRNGVTPGLGVVSRMDADEAAEVVGLGFRWIHYATDRHILRRGLADGIGMLRAAMDAVPAVAG